MNELRSSRLLRLFGFFLALSHLLTFRFWISGIEGFLGVLTDFYPVCWPFLPACESWPRLSLTAASILLILYALTSCAAAVCFLARRLARFALPLLAAASLLKLFLYLQDYRMMGNYHYMHWWILAAYFFIGQKDITIRFLLLAFYFSAGLLKLNREWLSGSALLQETFLKGPWLEAACAYVVVLELVLIFGLLARRDWIFWATIAQLFVFHVFSYLVVGFYYPAMMFSFLSIVVAGRLWKVPWHWRSLFELRWPARTFLIVFLALQSVPWIMGGDPALDGRGRLLALNMLDAMSECKSDVEIHFKNQTFRPEPLYSQLGIRLHCDPVVKLAEARHYCRNFKVNENFESMDVSLFSKRKSDAKLREIFAFKDFCRHPRRPNIFGLIEAEAVLDR